MDSSAGAWAGELVGCGGLSVGAAVAVGAAVPSSPDPESEHAANTTASARIKNMYAGEALVRMLMSKLVEAPLRCLTQLPKQFIQVAAALLEIQG